MLDKLYLYSLIHITLLQLEQHTCSLRLMLITMLRIRSFGHSRIPVARLSFDYPRLHADATGQPNLPNWVHLQCSLIHVARGIMCLSEAYKHNAPNNLIQMCCQCYNCGNFLYSYVYTNIKRVTPERRDSFMHSTITTEHFYNNKDGIIYNAP